MTCFIFICRLIRLRRILKIMSGANGKIYVKKLEKAGYILHNVTGDCNVFWNRLDLLAAFVYCLYSIVDSVKNIILILVPNLSQQTDLVATPLWEAVWKAVLLAGQTFSQPIVLINFILVVRLAIKLRIRNKAIEEKGFLILSHEKHTDLTRFSSPVDLRFRSLKRGIKVSALMASILAVFLFTNKTIYFQILLYGLTIIVSILIFKDEFLENLIHRYNAEEHIYKRECIY